MTEAEIRALDHDRLIEALLNAQSTITSLSEQNALLRRLHFGVKSERHIGAPGGQGELGFFNEAERDHQPVAEEEDSAATPTKNGAKRGRKPLPANLDRVTITHDVSEAESVCPCCRKPRPLLSDEVTEELEYIPAHMVVHRHVRKNYGACRCSAFENSGIPAVLSAPGPVKIIAGSQYSNRTIAQFITAKFVDGLPFYRQEAITARAGFEVSRQTMAYLSVRIGSLIGPLVELMIADTKRSEVLRMDETTVQVLKEAGRKPQAKSYAWVSYAYHDHRPILVFRYNQSREAKVASDLLSGYTGYLQTDGYAGYNDSGGLPGIVHVGCWAHIRREFKEALDASEGKDVDANTMLTMIRALYDIETGLRMKLVDGEINAATFLTQRAAKAAKVLDRIELWLDERKERVAPKSALGKAIQYAIGQFPRAKRYIEHVLLTPDNNPIERAIRPFVTGRKNWLFCDTPHGAHASMGLYSLVMTAKANGLEPCEYLKTLFDLLPQSHSDEDLTALLPYHIAQKQGVIPGGYFPAPSADGEN